MKKKKVVSILLMAMMLVTFMPSMTFADEVQPQNEVPVLMAKATVSGTSAVKLQWQNLEDATKYVVYGSQYGKKAVKIKTLDASHTSYIIKKIGKKKIVKHKVYSFYVSAYKTSLDGEVENTEFITKSNTCTLISGKTMGKNNKYSNPTSIKVKNALLKLEKEDSGKVQTLAGISSKMYKNKKHLVSKYGSKYRYLVFNDENQLDDTVVNIDEQGVITINEQAKVGDKAKVTIQEINGVTKNIEVLVVTSEEQTPPEEDNPDIGGGGGSGGGGGGSSIETDKAKEKAKLLEDFEKVYQDTLAVLDDSNLAEKTNNEESNLNATKEELADPVATIKGILEGIRTKYKADIDKASTLNDMVNISSLAKTKLISIQNILVAVPAHPSEKVCQIAIDAVKDIRDTSDTSQISIKTFAAIQAMISEGVVCVIELDANGGSLTTNNIQVYYQQSVVGIKVDVPKLDGSTFLGYFTNKTDGQKVVDYQGNFVKSVDGYVKDGKWIRQEDTTLYAHWVVNQYEVELKAGAEGTDGRVLFKHGDSEYIDFVEANLNGYTCTGYYTLPVGGEKILSEDGSLAKGSAWTFDYSILYAQWTPKECKITIDANGGTPNQNISINYENSRMISGTPVMPTRAGYTFNGIYTLEDGGKLIVPSMLSPEEQQAGHFFVENCEGYVKDYKWIRSQDTTLYVHWIPKTYSIELKTDEQGTTSGTAQISYGSSSVEKITYPQKDGYICTGYYTEKEAGSLVLTSAGFVVSKNVTGWTKDGKWIWMATENESAVLYPHWTQNNTTVTLQANYDGGAAGQATVGTNDTKIDIQSGIENRQGYQFLGYYDGADDDANLIADSEGNLVNGSVSGIVSNGKWASDAKAITLYAHWTAKLCHITFKDLEGGNEDFTLDINYDTNSFTTTPSEFPTREGYKLKGFYADAEGKNPVIEMTYIPVYEQTVPLFVQYCKGYVVDQKWIRAEDTTLYTVWEPLLCEITFRDKLCGNDDYKIHINYVTGLFEETELAFPTSNGYELEGFETQAGQMLIEINNGIPTFKNVEGYIQGYKWIRSEDVTLYAKWKAKECKIILEDPSEENDPKVYTVNYGTGEFVGNQPTLPTRKGYTLEGFYADSEADDTQVINVQNHQLTFNEGATDYVKDGKWNKTDDTTLYAHWKANQYAITLDKNGGDADGNATIEYGKSKATVVQSATRAGGYVVDGYYSDEKEGVKILDAQGNIVNDRLGITDGKAWAFDGDYKLYAHWTTSEYTVNLVDQEGNSIGTAAVDYHADRFNIQNVTVPKGYEVKEYQTLAGVKVANADGIFVDSSVDSYIDNGLWIYQENATIRVITEEKLCKITFKSTLGQLEDSIVYINYELNQFKVGGEYPYPQLPSLTGYDLLGFYTSSNGGNLVITMTQSGPLFNIENVEGYLENQKWIREKDTTLYAHWKAKTYNVTLSSNVEDGVDGSVAYDYDATLYNRDSFVPASRTGYTCLGYYDNEGCIGEPILTAEGKLANVGAKWNYAQNKTLYAKWQGNTCIIHLDPNGSSATYNDYSIEYASKLETITNPQIKGHTFAGWFTEKTGGIKVIDENGNVISNITGFTDENGNWVKDTKTNLYAQYEANETILTLDKNGASAGGTATIKYEETQTISMTKVSREGFACDGYYTSSVGGEKLLDNEGNIPARVSVAGYISNGKWVYEGATLTLYPHWIANQHNITINQNYPGSKLVSTMVKTDDTSINFDIERKGYTLVGLYAESTGDTLIVNADGSFDNNTVDGYISEGKWKGTTANTTLYAKWQVSEYTITLNNMGGTGQSTATVQFGADSINFTPPTKAGYEFAGWCTDQTCINMLADSEGKLQDDLAGYVKSGVWCYDQTCTLYAKWTPKTYNVKLILEGEDSVTATVKTGDSKIVIPSETQIKKTGYELTGFFSAQTYGSKICDINGTFVKGDTTTYLSNGVWCGTEDVQLYALWTPVEYEITFDAAGGTGGSKKAKVYYDANTLNSVDDVPNANVVKPTNGKDLFAGWYTAAGELGNEVIDTNGQLKEKWTYAKATTLYAHWIKSTFKAVYNSSSQTLTFYYDTVDYSGSNVTVYDNLQGNGNWPYENIRSDVRYVDIDSSVEDYHGLTSTKNMFASMGNAKYITGAQYLDVSNVTDMSYMFYNFGSSSTTINSVPDVSRWDTSNVTNMSYMFSYFGGYSTTFYSVPDVSRWDTSNVTNMSYMFYSFGVYSTTFNSVPDVSRWDTSNVTNISYMFEHYGEASTALNFKLDLTNWSVAKVTSYSSMFGSAGYKAATWSVTIPAKTSKRANETYKWYVGDGTNTSKYISPAYTSSGMYRSFKLPSKQFKAIAEKDTDGEYILTMYYDDVDHNPEGNSTIKEYIEPFNNGSWRYSEISSNIKKVVIDISMRDYHDLASTKNMFNGMSNAEEITGAQHLDVSNVTDMSYMFAAFGGNSTTLNSVPDVSRWDTSNVTDMSYMFSDFGYISTTINSVPDVSRWDTSNVTNMSCMFEFYGWRSTALNFKLDLTNWSVAKVTSYSSMFSSAGYKAATWSVTIPEKTGDRANESAKWYVGGGTNTSRYISPEYNHVFKFAGKHFKAVAEKDTDGKYILTMYYDDVDHNPAGRSTIKEYIEPFNNGSWKYSEISSNIKKVVIDISMRDYHGLTSTNAMFSGMSNAEEITGAQYLDVSNVTDMSYMFYNFGSSSTTINSVPDVSRWDVSNVTNMSAMFYCYGMSSTALNFNLNLTLWDLRKLNRDVYGVFAYSGYKAATWSVTIPKKTGDRANEAYKWYVGDGEDTSEYISPSNGRSFEF